MKNYFEPIQYFYANNVLILLQKYHFCCKAPKNQQAFFHFAEKSFSVFNREPSHSLKVFSSSFFRQNILLFFFNVHEKCVLYQFKYFISTIHRCCHKILFISVMNIRICISKSFMRSRFLLPPFIYFFTALIKLQTFADKIDLVSS